MKKTIIAQLSIMPERVNDFLNLAKQMVNQSTAEKGCLAYRLLQEIDSTNDFMVYEKYVSEEAVEYHNASTHYNEFLNAAMPLLSKEPVLESY